MGAIINRESIAHLDLTDQGLVSRAVCDHCEAVLALIRPMDARQALKTVTDLTALVERQQGRKENGK